jgi:DNA ligase (NAD+)
VLSERPKGLKPWVFPTTCPCPYHYPLVREGTDAAHYCRNPVCPVQQAGWIEHFASREAMDIEGLGESRVQLFVDRGFIDDIGDIYSIDFDRLRTFAVTSSPTRPLPRVAARTNRPFS